MSGKGDRRLERQKGSLPRRKDPLPTGMIAPFVMDLRRVDRSPAVHCGEAERGAKESR